MKAKKFLKLQKEIRALEAEQRAIIQGMTKLRHQVNSAILKLRTAKLKIMKARDAL